MFCNLECLLLISGFSGILFLARAFKNKETTEDFDNLIFRSEGPTPYLELPWKDFVSSGCNSQSIAQSYSQNQALKLESSFSCFLVIKAKMVLRTQLGYTLTVF